MATSGSKSVTVTSWDTLTFSWSQSSQSIANNSTTISWKLQLISTAYGYINAPATASWSVKVNGTSYSGTNNVSIANNTTKTLASGTTTITHDSDGTKTFSFSFSQSFNMVFSGVSIGSKSGSGTGTLTKIARASSVSLPTCTMGTAATITITRAVSSFTHTLTYKFGSSSGTIATKTTSTSVSWTPPESLATQIKSSTSGTVTITCTTYSGTTTVGSSTCTATLKIPSSMVPTLSGLTIERVDGSVPASWGIYVQGKSKAKLTITGAAGVSGSTISSYSISGGGYSSTASSFTTGFLNSSGSVTFTASVTDSRGRKSASKTVTISVQEYKSPAFVSSSAYRANGAGAAAGDGTYICAKNEYNFSSCGGRNTLTTETYFKKTSDSSWTNANKAFTSGAVFYFGDGGISGDFQYNLLFKLKDTFGEVSVSKSIPSAAVIMDFKAGGTGLAIGTMAEEDGLTIDWPTKAKKNIICTSKDIGLWHRREDDQGNIISRVGLGVGTSNINRGVYDGTFEDWIIYRNSLNANTNIINGNTKVNGTLTVNNHATAVGTVSDSNSTDELSVPNAAWTDSKVSLSLGTGTYVLSFSAAFAAAAGKRRGARIQFSTDGGSTYSTLSNSTGLFGGSSTSQNITYHGSAVSYTTNANGLKIKLQLYQDSGAALKVTSTYLRAVRIS